MDGTTAKPEQPSGGDRRKVGVIRALRKNADVLLLDEPTSAKDTGSKERLMEYLQEIKHEK